MDGARRVLRSLTEHIAAPFAVASARPQFASAGSRAVRRLPPRVRRSPFDRLHAFAVHPLATGMLVFGVLGGAFAYSAVQGGAYQQFIRTSARPATCSPAP